MGPLRDHLLESQKKLLYYRVFQQSHVSKNCQIYGFPIGIGFPKSELLELVFVFLQKLDFPIWKTDTTKICSERTNLLLFTTFRGFGGAKVLWNATLSELKNLQIVSTLRSIFTALLQFNASYWINKEDERCVLFAVLRCLCFSNRNRLIQDKREKETYR